MISKTTRWLYAALALILAPAIAFAQPANDLCAGAIPITFINSQGSCAAAGPTTLAFTSDGTTDSGVPTACSNPGLDQWFTWTATSTGLNWDQQNPGGPGIAVFASCADAATGTSIDCRNTLSDGFLSGWAVGDNLIIQIYDFNGSFSDVAFCLEEYTPPPPPANDECATATPVTLGMATCGPTVMADNTSATGTAGDVCGSTSTSYGDGDIWFSFVAGTSTVFLDLISEPGGGTAGSLYISVYDGCGGTCVYNNNLLSTTSIETISGLTPGSSYLIRMYESGNNVFGAFEFCMFNAGTPPVNDECAAATPVTLGSATCGPTVMADNSFATGTAGDVCGSTSTSYGDADVWFSFVAGTESVFLDLISEPGGGTAASMYISVYDACGGACVYNNNSISTTSIETIPGLTPGSTYYIRMYDFGANDFGAFEFCMYNSGMPPPNDECAGATPVTLGSNTCGPTVFTDNSFATGIAGDVCGSTSTSYGGADIWFSFEAGGPTAVLDLITEPGGVTSPSMYISVYDDCGGNCVYNNNFISLTTNETITGLTAGEIYYIRMYDFGGNDFGAFEFCMFTPPPPPVNDVCAGAIPATVGANGTCPTGAGAYSEDFTYVTQSGLLDPSCGNFSEYDLFYTWEATAASIEFTSGTGAPDLAIYSGTCGSLTEVGCLSTSGTIGGLTIGTSYTLMVHDGSAGASLVEWCLQEGPACGDPTSLAVSNIAEFTADVTFNAIASGGHTVEYGPIGFTPGTGTTVAVPTGGMVTLTGLSSMTGYDVYVTADCGSAVVGPETFTTLGPPPVNDMCGGATPVTLGVNGVCGPTVMTDNTNATGIAGDVCGSTSTSYGGADIWFSFVAAGVTATLDLISEPGGVTAPSMYISVYDACGGNCVYNNNSISTTTNETITGLTFGETYYIRMYDFGANDFGAFEFCMSTPPPPPTNDVCSGALPANVGGLGTCPGGAGSYSEDFSFVNNTTQFASCDGFGNYDLWYSWTATATSIDFTSGTGAPGFAVYDNDCATFTELGCLNNVSGTVTGLVVGNEYLLQVWDDSQGATTVEWCLEAESSVPLPVELASFTAYATTEGNVVEWTAATEVDFYMYTVERALDPASFTALAEVAPKGTTYAEAVYTSQDINPATVTYYRLRMEDLDGTVEYSDVVAVTRDDISGGIKMFPNPAKEHVTFEVLSGVSDNGTIDVVLTDLNGRTIREWNLAAGQRTSVSLSGIPSGVYMVSSVSAAGTASQRLVID